MKMLRSLGQLCLIWLGILAALAVGAFALAAIDPLNVDQVSYRRVA